MFSRFSSSMPPRRSSPFFGAYSTAYMTVGAFISASISTSIVVSLAACPAPSANDAGINDAGVVSDGGNPDADGGIDDGGTDAGVDAGPIISATGLDTRPSNTTCVAPERPIQDAAVVIEPAFPNLSFNLPIALVQFPSDDSQFILIEKTGIIKRFANDPNTATASVIADLRDRVSSTANEAGLLGIAFHPKFNDANNPIKDVFLSYTARGSGGNPLQSRVSRFHVVVGQDGVPTNIDTANEEILLALDQPFANHNGGHIDFGPDGYLYISFGDGGSANDPRGNGQNKDALLGKLLRIDVDVDAANHYAIPADNPFASGGGRAEIYAYGLRNVWKFSFDTASGQLWAADVGQNRFEEVNIVERGGNYGWNIKEGDHCFAVANCTDVGGLIDPIAEYPHSEGLSITGGFVYHGTNIPSLDGIYIYGDFQFGTVFGLFFDPVTGEAAPRVLSETNFFISSFAQDQKGEVYLLHYNVQGGTGRILKINPQSNQAGEAPVDAFPKKLSETGCVDPQNPTRIAAGVISYEPQVPFWSDHAEKTRYFAIPDGTQITQKPDGDFDLPIGSVTLKNFRLGNKLVETRMMVRHSDGEWAGYTYEWNDEQTDAVLLNGAKSKIIDGQTWVYPSRAQCLACHTPAAGRTLGLEALQLNSLHTYDETGLTANQLDTLEHINLLAGPRVGIRDARPSMPKIDDEFASLELRAKAYLHSNCAYCHQPGATGQGPADLRYNTPFASMQLCDVEPQEGNLGRVNARLLTPQNPDLSILSVRMHTTDVTRMPKISSSVVDPDGTSLIDAWITSVTACPPAR